MIASLKSPFSTKSSSCSEELLHGFTSEQSSVVVEEESQKASCSAVGLSYDEKTNTTTRQLPLNVDPEVFNMLPEEIQKELLSPPYLTSMSSPSATDASQISQNKPSEPSTDSQNVKNTKEAANAFNTSDRTTTVTKLWPAGTTQIQNVTEGDKLSSPQSSSDCKFPGNVDPGVFSELPPDVQRELMSEWKQQKPIMNIPSSRKPGRNWMSKDRKAAGKSSQSNNLLKYFKPS